MDTASQPIQLQTTCCIVGGGPAGMMAGYLLARAGIEVVVLEKHADFLRDFRGDTIHPSTLDLMWELGLLEKLLDRPHQEVQQLRGVVGDTEVTIADFSRLPTHCKFVALMPQWEFLDFLATEARHFPSFRIEMQAEAVDLIEEAGTIVGVRANTLDGPMEIRAALTIGADGRRSIVRRRGGLAGARIWRPDRRVVDAPLAAAERSERAAGPIQSRQDSGDDLPRRLLAMRVRNPQKRLRRNPQPRAGGVPRRNFGNRSVRAKSSQRIAQLGRYPALHRASRSAGKMAPAGVVVHRRCGPCDVADRRRRHQSCHSRRRGRGKFIGKIVAKWPAEDSQLQLVQQRREWPTKVIQTMQLFIQKRILSRALESKAASRVPWIVRLLQRWPARAGFRHGWWELAFGQSTFTARIASARICQRTRLRLTFKLIAGATRPRIVSHLIDQSDYFIQFGA